jgi:hypothetical protein
MTELTHVIPAKAGIVRPRGRFASAVKVRAWVGRSPVIEGHCVAVRRGLEQVHAKTGRTVAAHL